MSSHWRFWCFWIPLNALSSFIWGNLVLSPTIPSILGMVIGVAFFIVLYSGIDNYLIKNRHLKLHKSLRMGVYTKAIMQVLNLSVILGYSLSPEIWAGIVSVGFTDEVLHINANKQVFIFALVNTIITGAILSILVAALTFMFSFVPLDKLPAAKPFPSKKPK